MNTRFKNLDFIDRARKKNARVEVVEIIVVVVEATTKKKAKKNRRVRRLTKLFNIKKKNSNLSIYILEEVVNKVKKIFNKNNVRMGKQEKR